MTAHDELIKRIRRTQADCPDSLEAADAIEQLQRRISELEAARIAYASEFAPNADGEPDVGSIHANIRAMKKDAERCKELCKDLANIMHDQTVAMQSALIEWMFGKGAEDGLRWIVNTLEGPGLLPETDAEHGHNAQFWFDTHRSDPFPKCFCGNPSHTLWMGQGFCCNEHYKEAKAKYDAAKGENT